jgi:hypothetical protein
MTCMMSRSALTQQAGEFMGEYGVGVSEAIGVGEPKKVTALEIWLFDKNDIKTATKGLDVSSCVQRPCHPFPPGA